MPIGTVKLIRTPEKMERLCSKGKTKGYINQEISRSSRTVLIGVQVKCNRTRGTEAKDKKSVVPNF